MATLLELVTSVGRKTGMSVTAGSDDRAALDEWANDGVRKVLLDTHIYVNIGDMTLTAGEADYRFDEDILAVLNTRLTISSVVNTLTQVTSGEMMDIRRLESPSEVRYYCVLGHDMLLLAGTPTTADTLRVFYVPLPTEMTADGHDPSVSTYGGIPVFGHKAIEKYMEWEAAIRNDKERANGVDAAERAYKSEIAWLRKHIRGKAGRTIPRPRVGYPGRFISTRNDRYP